MATNVSAQWHKVVIPADELLGTPKITTYLFQADEGSISFGDNGTLVLWTNKGIFDYNSNHELEVLMGIYDANDRLVLKGRYIFKVHREGSTAWALNFDDIFNLVKNKNCTVRVIAERYANSQFDVKTQKMEVVYNIQYD